MHPIIFTQAARAELIEARDWYEDESSGLGLDFIAAVADTTQRLSARPRHFPLVYKNIRRALLHRFPYSLFFVLKDDETLTVIACFHGSRNPKHWQTRI